MRRLGSSGHSWSCFRTCKVAGRPGEVIAGKGYLVNITVQGFARLRDIWNASEIRLELPSDATVDSLREALYQRNPVVRSELPTLLIAVNCEYAEGDCVLRPNDEIAVFPPVSGG